MNAQETNEAMAGAYFLPTMGLTPLVISLLAFLRYTLEVDEIFSKSGNSVSWNLEGRSVNSEMRSSSVTWTSTHMGCMGFWIMGSLCWTIMGLDLSEVGLVELDGFEVELSFLDWDFIMGNVESVMGLVLFLGDEVVRFGRSFVWFNFELSFMIFGLAVRFSDERVVVVDFVVWFFFWGEDDIFFLTGRS